MTDPKRIACFFSTSGHSGVDQAAKHLIPALARRGYRVDLLKVRYHGPELQEVPAGVEVIDLGSRHTYGCVPGIVRYLRRKRPVVMLSDKDRVNRTALFAQLLARVRTRLVFRSGTTISIDLATRSPLERWIQRNSMGKLYRLADNVIVNSWNVADDMAAYTGLPHHLINVVPNPAVPECLFEQEHARPDHAWFAPGEPPVLLGVGELGTRKDFETLIRAFALVRRQRPCRLVILGEGNQRDYLEGLIRELGLGAEAELPGFKPTPIQLHGPCHRIRIHILMGRQSSRSARSTMRGYTCSGNRLSKRSSGDSLRGLLRPAGSTPGSSGPRQGYRSDPERSATPENAQGSRATLRNRDSHGRLSRGDGFAASVSGGVQGY